MKRFFVEDQSIVEAMLPKLIYVKHDFYTDEIMLDESTGQYWVKYLFELEGEDALGLRCYPYMAMEEIIAIALTTPYEDEVNGAMALLNHLEWTERLDFRKLLLDEIEANSTSIGLSRFDVMYERAELWTTDNRREILGKHYQEVKEDAAYFEQLALRACAIRTRIQQSDSVK